MGWRQRLLTGCIPLLLAISPNAAPASADTCVTHDRVTGVCTSSNLTPNGAAVGAQQQGSGGAGADASGWTPPPGWFFCTDRWRPPEDRQTAICRDNFTVTGPPVPTLADLREFYPSATEITSEPQGWAVRDVPANLIVSASGHVRSGAVLGIAAEVRFTPVTVRWDYGDGTTASTETGGSTWQSLGQPRFSDTATSHRFSARGAVTVTAVVDYAVSYRFAGGPWHPVDGTLTIPATPTTLRVVVGSTVLTTGPCTATSARTC